MRWLIAVALSGVAPLALARSMSVTIDPSSPSPIAVGAPVMLTADVSDASDGRLWYRYRVRRMGEDMRLIRDFGPEPALLWTNTEEGSYEIELTVRDIDTNESATTTLGYDLVPRISGDTPAVSNTGNALVLLYSAPPCDPGSRMRVDFQDPSGYLQSTPYRACRAGQSMNFYVAGLLQNTQYTLSHTIDTGSEFRKGPVLTATTGSVDLQLAPYRVVTGTPGHGVLLQSTLAEPTVATDLSGNVIWYYGAENITSLTRPEAGGRFLGIYQDPQADPSHQVVREFDLAGITLQETNAARINEYLASQGKRLIDGFHHEARRLPDGKLMLLASVEQAVTDAQGAGNTNVLGDMILVLDANLVPVWTWDSFNYLNPSRLATLDETCKPQGGGCPPFYNSAQANDWLHGNSLQMTPEGNILYSIRHQDWIAKIDFANGTGTGAVLWRMGKDGDFQFQSDDPFPWPSHQHDPNVDPRNPGHLAVFDNGNIRQAADSNAHSRGQVIQFDENGRAATLLLNVDLGYFSRALGSAQFLSNGNYHFNLGWITNQEGKDASRSVEVDPTGKVVYAIETTSIMYRTFRMDTMYQP